MSWPERGLGVLSARPFVEAAPGEAELAGSTSRWRAGRVRPAIVDSFPVDSSVYGVRGLAGNVQDWCGEPHQRRGPDVSDGRVPTAPANSESVGFRLVRSSGSG